MGPSRIRVERQRSMPRREQPCQAKMGEKADRWVTSRSTACPRARRQAAATTSPRMLMVTSFKARSDSAAARADSAIRVRPEQQGTSM